MKHRRTSVLFLAALGALAVSTACDEASPPPRLTPCSQLFEGCSAKRMPDVTLTGEQTSGAFRSVDGMDVAEIISFDAALRRAGAEDGYPDAQTVQVTLGSADGDALHWGEGIGLYYAVRWSGVCVPGRGPPGGSPSTTSCLVTEWVTVIDARTGAFIVGGNG